MLMDPLDFFPYPKMRPLQKELTRDLNAGRILLCNAPTGIGKSVSALCNFLAGREEDEKIVVLTRTKSQAKIFLDEMHSICKRVGRPYLTVQLRSKRDFCPVFEKDESDYEEFLQLCRLHDGCEHRRRFRSNAKRMESLAEEIAEENLASGAYQDFWKLAEKAKEYGCPYMVLQGLLPYSDVVIASYLYLVHPFLRDGFLKKLGRSMEELLLIFDEAHNLQGLDILSRDLRPSTVDRAAEETGLDLPSFESLFGGEDAELDVLSCVDIDDISILYEAGLDVLRRGLAGGRKVSYAYRAASFLDQAVKLRSDDNWVLFRQYGVLHLKSLFPSEIVRPLTKAKKLLFMSGTLTPIEGYKVLYGVQESKALELPNVFPRENRYFLSVEGLNTGMAAREEFGEELWALYSEAIEAVHLASPRTTLAFFPSYGIAKEVGKRLNVSALEEPMESGKVEEFWRRVTTDEKKLALAVSGGKMSEGVEFTVRDGDGRRSVVASVIVAGFPFPVPDFEMEMKGKYYEKAFGSRRAFFLLSVLPMVNKVLQGVGRAVRSERDRAAVVFLDDRREYFAYFPEELRHELKFIDMAELRGEVQWFHAHG